MKVNILEKNTMPLTSRTEIKVELTFEHETPSKESLKKEVVKQTKADESLMLVKKIKTEFGTQHAVADIYVYDSKEAMQKMERTTKHMKTIAKKAEEDAAKAKEEAKAAKEEEKEAPAEEAKEESKEEAEKEGKSE